MKLIWRAQRPRIANMLLKGKINIGELTLSNLETYNKVTVIREHGINGRIEMEGYIGIPYITLH